MTATTTYQVYYKRMMICQGPIDYVAEALFISIPTARGCIYSRNREHITVKTLPILYEVLEQDNVVLRGTCHEIALELGVTADWVRRSARNNSLCCGRKVRKYMYQFYMMPEAERRELLNR